ncbi:MAG: AMP-binding protein [Bacteroidetes bacterium]|nr:AMP-binding protein [Bacteroidota bacterium]
MSYPWLKYYPAAVNHTIDVNEYSSLMDVIDKSLVKWGDKTAYINMDKGLTFAQVDVLSRRFAAYLQQACGVKKGDRIAIQMPNCLQYPVVMFGAIRTGAIIVNTNPLYTPTEMEHQFRDSGAKVLIALENFAGNVEKVLPKTKIEYVILTKLGDMLGLKGHIVNLVVKHVKKMVPSYELPKAIWLKEAMSKAATMTYTRPELAHSDVAMLQYTGGTTGVSKGAMLTNLNIIANMLQIYEWKKPCLQEGKETVITALPLYHIFALTVNCLAMLKFGALNILVTNPRDMKAFIGDMKKYPFSVLTGVNTLFNGLLNQEAFRQLDFSKLKVTVGGGMAVQIAVADAWKKLTGVTIVEGYGLTESSPVLTCNPTDGTEQLGTIGIPLPSTDISIRNDEGEEVKAGEHGEIWGRGPQVMMGYWQRPDETAKTMHGEWLKTGDIGMLMDTGFFKIVDRKKEMVLVSGFNVYPNEVEDAIAKNPKVLEVGVIGVPDEKSNEAVKAFVVKKDQNLTEEEVISHCQEFLTGYKRPKYVEFVTELPKSNVGKILRRVLKEMDQRNHPDAWK